jgi:hypothetical protein
MCRELEADLFVVLVVQSNFFVFLCLFVRDNLIICMEVKEAGITQDRRQWAALEILATKFATVVRFWVDQVVTSSGSFWLMAIVATSWAMPPLPGAQVMFSGFVPVLISALIIACSRAPEPKTKIFIRSSLWGEP